MKKHSQKLKTSFFLVPTITLLLSLCVILIAFNVVIQKYIDDKTSKVLSDEFSFFDNYYDEVAITTPSQDDAEEFIIIAHQIILDQDYKVIYPTEPWSSDQEGRRTLAIAAKFRDEQLQPESQVSTKIETKGKTYYVRSKKYRGVLDGYWINKATGSRVSQDYLVIVYTNITPIQRFLDILNRTLLLLMALCGGLCIFILFDMAKRMDRSFNKLKNYILKAGRREPLEDLENMPYDEFNRMAKAVQQMSDMIRRAEDSQKTFFQNASHELRTPLMSIQGYAEGISTGVLKEPMKAAQIIGKESQKMSTLVDEILFLSKMDTQNEPMSVEAIYIKELLYDCSGSIKAAADKKGIRLIHELPAENISLSGNESLLTRAFSNLLSNALRYANTKILISCEVDKDLLRIRIGDDGKGIAEKDLPHIFQRFYKGDQGNFGIGLAITKEIIQQHHGSISAFHQDKLTVFEVLFPFSL